MLGVLYICAASGGTKTSSEKYYDFFYPHCDVEILIKHAEAHQNHGF